MVQVLVLKALGGPCGAGDENAGGLRPTASSVSSLSAPSTEGSDIGLQGPMGDVGPLGVWVHKPEASEGGRTTQTTGRVGIAGLIV